MKICVIQPEYSTDYGKSDELFQKELDFLKQCDSSIDLICLPESCDVPALADAKEDMEASSHKYNQKLIDAVKETAVRCNSLVFFNARSTVDGKLRNTTYAVNRKGEIVGQYFKQHLVRSEVYEYKLGSDYTFEYSEPTVIEIEGLRFAFLTCYDFYFYEAFSNIARQNVDIIIGCSHQRSDTALALQILTQNIAYNTNAYVIRSSVSMGENATLGGCSMVVAPTGEVLTNLYSKIGMTTVDIDPKAKYFKPAGYGNPPSAHYEYIEKGRRPWKYRPSGSAIVPTDEFMPYPRICAHRGFPSVAPENSIPSFASAISLGAEEIEFDLWSTVDGEIVSMHGDDLSEVSNGIGKVYEKTLRELKELDFGSKYSANFKGLQIPTFEEILKKFSCHAIMNIHLKSDKNIDKIVNLIYKYDAQKHVYFMTSDENLLSILHEKYPLIPTCAGAGDEPFEIVNRAIKYGCKKIQLFKPFFTKEMIDKAHKNGIICNFFFTDDIAEADGLLDMGIDTVLTNDCLKISKTVAKREKYHLDF